MNTHIKLWQALVAIIVLAILAAGGSYMLGKNSTLKQSLMQAGFEPELEETEAARVQAKPDLTANNLKYTAQPASYGYSFSANIKNISSRPVDGVRAYLNIEYAPGNIDFIHLQPYNFSLGSNGMQTVTTFSSFSSYPIKVKICADYPSSAISESNENNNCTGLITLPSPNGPPS